MAKKKKLKKYSVSIDMTWSEGYSNISARTPGEAKKKAWNKFKSKPPKSNFNIDADEET
jgi:hypothetical protein